MARKKYIEEVKLTDNDRIQGTAINPFRLTVRDFLQDNAKNNVFRFFSDCEKNENKNCAEELIVNISKEFQPDINSIQTGNYVGKFEYNGIGFDIQSRFGEAFLKRMLNFANDVFLNDVDAFGDKKKPETLDFTRFIIFYLFLQSLEKAYLLGLPRNYHNVYHHEMRLKGRMEINRHIRHDIPFLGKISSVSRELVEVQEILDVLHKAVTCIEREERKIKLELEKKAKKTNQKSDKKEPNKQEKNVNVLLTKNIKHIRPHLQEMKSGSYVSSKTIAKAKLSKALINPIFSPYKMVLRYAEYIIKMDSLRDSKNQEDPYPNFLVNVAELFEIYVTKLLQKAFPDWDVSSPKESLYEHPIFFTRKIIPDIVMQKGNNVVVFDTKYKRMNYQGSNNNGMGDVDRNDFFQINTYMSYYQQQEKNVIAGGLLYPLSKDHVESECHSYNWLGNSKIKFIVDGIRVDDTSIDDMEKITSAEDDFIKRIQYRVINDR